MVAEKREVAVSLDAKDTGPVSLKGLKILYMDDKVDAQSRTFRFYVTLPNQLLREDTSPDGRRFVYWQFRPGQRSQISLPVERWEDRIVLPVEAVARTEPSSTSSRPTAITSIGGRSMSSIATRNRP